MEQVLIKREAEKDLIVSNRTEGKLDKLTDFIKGKMDECHYGISGFQTSYDNMIERTKIDAYYDVLEEVERMKDLPVNPDQDDERIIKSSKNALTDKILSIFTPEKGRSAERRLQEIRAGKVADIIEGLFMQFYMLGVNSGARGTSTIDSFFVDEEVEKLKSYRDKCKTYRSMANDPMFLLFLADMAGVDKKDLAGAREAFKQTDMPDDIAKIVDDNYFDML